MQLPSLQQLLEAGVHFGHQVNRWHPKMEQYIYGSRDNIHIIDLLKTREKLDEASKFLKEAAVEGKVILFLGTKHQAQDIISEEAQLCGMPYLTKRWVGGLFTNWDQMKRNIDKLNRYEQEKEGNKLSMYTKKERLLMERKMAKVASELQGVQQMAQLPAILFVVDPKKESIAVSESLKRGITVVALCDTNANPDGVSYPIPGNDDSLKSVRLLVHTIAEAIKEGRAVFEKTGEKKAADDAAPIADEPIIANVADVIEEVVKEVEGAIQDERNEEPEGVVHEAVTEEKPIIGEAPKKKVKIVGKVAAKATKEKPEIKAKAETKTTKKGKEKKA